MKRIFAIAAVSLFLTAVAAPVSVSAQEPQKKECTKTEKECTKTDKKECTKDKSECTKDAKKSSKKAAKKENK